MTIRLTNPMHAIEVDPPRAPTTYHIVFVGNQAVALADTEAEALEAKRAIENVLLPRFTRDEAIAIVLETMPEPVDQACEHHLRGIRLALEALAAVGVFVDEPPCARCNGRGGPLVQVPSRPGGIGKMKCAECGNRPQQTMADRLDAAGIK